MTLILVVLIIATIIILMKRQQINKWWERKNQNNSVPQTYPQSEEAIGADISDIVHETYDHDAATGATEKSDVAEQVTKLSKLHSDGALTDGEFQALKNRLVSQSDVGANQEAVRLLEGDRGSLLKKVTALILSGSLVFGSFWLLFLMNNDEGLFSM